MDEAAIQKLVDKYLEGTCTEEEKNIVESWYNSFDTRQDSLVGLSEAQKEEISRMMLAEIKSNIRSQESVRPRQMWIQYAAAAAAVLAIILTFANNRKSFPLEESTDVPGQMITIVNSEKHIQRLSLPDSSIIWLQPGAEVSYPGVFGKLREVTMTGDVFFEVHKDASHPFVVSSGKIITRVLGTSFRVRALENDPMAIVTVLSGKVSVKRILRALPKKGIDGQDPDILQEVLLLPNEKVLFSDRAMVVQKNETAGKKELEMWRKSTVSFHNVVVEDVLVQLSKLFDVQISTSSAKINRYLLKADFTGMNLPDILEILENSLDVTYEIDGDKIVLKPID